MTIIEPTFLSIQKNTATPLYEQLYLQIKQAIQEGRIAEGVKLPSKRQLMDALSVSQTTIELAYAQLVAEGFIRSSERKGYFVENVEEITYMPAPDASTVQTKPTVPYAIDFNSGKIDAPSFPFTTWRKLAKDIWQPDSDILYTGHPQGDEELRQEIAQYVFTSRGVKCEPEQIVVGAGTEQLLPILLQLLGDKAHYAIEQVSYPLTKRILENNEKSYVSIPVDLDGMRIDQLENEHVQIAYVTPSHQFPTGAVLTAKRRTQLLNWAASDPNRFIIEDDYDSEFRYVGKPIPSLHSMDKSNRVIYMSTFSKSIMPSLRIAYFILPPSLLTVFQTTYQAYSCTVPRGDQKLLTAFMQQGHFAKHLNRMRKIYRKKMELLLELFKPYEQQIEISGQEAGTHFLLTMKDTTISEHEWIQKAKQQHIRIYGLSEYAVEPNFQTTKAHLLLGYGGFSEEEIKENVQKLLQAFDLH